MQRALCGTICLAALLAPAAARPAEVGSSAPALEPTEWLNHTGGLSWKDLKGRVVLVEKWATW